VSIAGRCGGLHWSASVISEICLTCPLLVCVLCVWFLVNGMLLLFSLESGIFRRWSCCISFGKVFNMTIELNQRYRIMNYKIFVVAVFTSFPS